MHLTACGGANKWTSNIERDMLTKAKHLFGITLDPMLLPIYRFQKPTGRPVKSLAAVLLPHEVHSCLEEFPSKYAAVFGVEDDWERFWALVRNQRWLREHPMRHVVSSMPRQCVPFVLHNDDAPVSRRVGRSIRATNLIGPLGQGGSSMESIIPLAVTVNDEVFAKAMEETVDSAITWSCIAASENRNPSSHPVPGAKLDRVREAKAGTACSKYGRRLIMVGFVGDWMMLALEFKLPHHYNCEELCMMDRARKSGTSLNFGDHRLLAGWTHTERSLSEYFDSLPSDAHRHVFTKLPGWHTFSFMEDQLHADCLGPRQHLSGSLLRDLSLEGTFGAVPSSGSWQSRLDVCLLEASVQFQAFIRRNKLQCSQPTFTVLKLSMHRQDDFPCLKCKGKNSVLVSRWLLQVVRNQPDSVLKSHRWTCLTGFMGLWDVVHDMRPRWILTEEERTLLCRFRECALMSYMWLHEHSVTHGLGKRGYNPTPKLHQIDHMVRRAIATRVSYHLWWCFKAEDLMGRLAKIALVTHGATCQKRVIQRWLVQWWLWLTDTTPTDEMAAAMHLDFFAPTPVSG